MKNVAYCVIILIQIQIGFGQVTWQQKKEKQGWKNEKIPTQCFVDFQRTHSFRQLESNDQFLNTPLGERAAETSLNVWSYSLGLLTNLGNYGRLETGIQWIQNGESFHYNSTENDSSFHYESRYRYIGMPFSLMLSYGKKFSFFFGPGITPMLFSGYAKKTDWTNAYGAQNEDRTNIKNNTYASAVIQVYGQVGIQLRNDNGWGTFCKGIYRKQLTNTYSKYNDYIHKALGWGIHFGITKQL